jgi:hypothetical protein
MEQRRGVKGTGLFRNRPLNLAVEDSHWSRSLLRTSHQAIGKRAFWDRYELVALKRARKFETLFLKDIYDELVLDLAHGNLKDAAAKPARRGPG